MQRGSAAVALVLFLSFSGCAFGLWPQPTSFTVGSRSQLILSSTFRIVTSSNSTILVNAAQRYSQLFFPFGLPLDDGTGPILDSLLLTVSSDNSDLYLGVPEDYTISTPSGPGQAVITASTIYGAMHGLETFSQLITAVPMTTSTSGDYSYYVDAAVAVKDSPRYPWRGLLIDTSRHYLEVFAILRQIDAMSYTKLNTLHWHTVDAQSFPIVSSSYPLLTKGAWAPTAIYTHEQIQQVVDYGKQRGVRVVPEFDVPGHAASWGVGYPNLTAICPASLAGNINNIPLDPTNSFTYDVLQGLFTEITGPKLFADQYFHAGGDELVYSCWTGDPAIAQWMKQNGMTTPQQLEQYFETKLINILTSLGKTPVFWQEVFQAGITGFPANTIIEVWEDHPTLQSVITAGLKGLYAAGNYLDQQIPNPAQTWYEWVDTWKNFYNNEPTAGISATPAQLNNIVGGEAAMWGEQVDSMNIDSRVWPRACAVAERLWSDKSVTDITDASNRLSAFRCTSLAQRGIGAGPIMPNYCPIPTPPSTRR